MADFNQAIAVILRHEGGFVHHPVDPGGATNWGISQRFLEGVMVRPISVDEIKIMPRETAIDLYREHWWDKYNYEAIIEQLIATKVFDIAVNTGPDRGHKILQRALNQTGCDLAVDGELGPLTMTATNEADPKELIDTLISQQLNWYEICVAKDPKKVVFLADWKKRAAWPIT